MKKMTSAYANKILKQLEEDKAFLLNKEMNSRTYVVAVGEEPVVPEYDFVEVDKEMSAIDEKIQIIKHAINYANVTNCLDVNGKTYSVDTILVRMAQLNKRKLILDVMRKQLPKERLENHRFASRGNSVPEYQYINYDLDTVKAEFEKVSDEIMRMQIELDKYNQTFEFDVDI